jgi:intraflagellar transport protein 122
MVQDAFRRAGRPDQSLRMLERLTHNAVTEHRYGDAGYYYWLLATETLKFVTATSPRDVTSADRVHLRRFAELERKAELYYAYNIIYRYTVEPFVTSTPETIFNTAQFILNAISTPGANEEAPHGISRVYTLIALAKQAKTLGAFKLARKVYERLATLRVPPAWRDQVDAAALTIRSKRFSDRDELLPICARCSTPNPLLGSGTVTADSCVHCSAVFVRSLHTFDALPLVEFSISDAVRFDDAQIRALIEDLPPIKQGNAAGAPRRGERHYGADVQTLEIDGDMPDDDMEQGSSQNDAFHQQLLNGEASMGGRLPPICVDSECVRAMPRPEVFVRKSMCPALPARYFRNVIPEVPISMCPSCCHFFPEEDFEFAVLQKKACPFCRSVVDI